MKKKYIRKNKKMLSVYLDVNLHDEIAKRAEFRGLMLSQWIKLAIQMKMAEEDKYL